MTTSFNGTTGITFPDASTQSNSQVGMKNRIIDGGFTINQRGYTSGTSLSSGTYGHDRWKGGASAGTYTFTQGALGVNTTITITAGSIIQVIEGCNLPEGGTYVLSWTGTAQGRLNGGTYGSSGTVTVTGWVAGTNLNVEFSTGTCGSVQLEKGSTATSFDYRPYGTELALCQRYCQVQGGDGTFDLFAVGTGNSTVYSAQAYKPQVTFRIEPSVSYSALADIQIVQFSDGTTRTITVIGVSTVLCTPNYVVLDITLGTAGTAGANQWLRAASTASARLIFSAEL